MDVQPTKAAAAGDEVEAGRRVEDLVTRRLGPANGPWQARLVLRSGTHGGPLVFAVSSTSGCKAVAKLFLHRHWAAIEYSAAQAVQASRAAVAPALLCDGAQGLLVTEWVEGPTLADSIDGGSWEEGLTQAGHWQRRFHRSTRLPPALYRPMGVLVGLCDVAASLPNAMSVENRAAIRQAAKAMAPRAARSLPGPCSPVRLHGDFHTGNLIRSPDGPVAIDTPGPARGLVARRPCPDHRATRPDGGTITDADAPRPGKRARPFCRPMVSKAAARSRLTLRRRGAPATMAGRHAGQPAQARPGPRHPVRYRPAELGPALPSGGDRLTAPGEVG